MTKRKGKSTTKQDDSLLLLEPSVAQPKGLKEYAVPAVAFFIFAVGGLTAVWFCSQQQQTIYSLSETVNAMQLRITKFQQQLGMGNAQIANVGVFEERLQALEEAYMQAQKKAEVALATSEKIQSTDLSSQLWSLQSEMNAKLSELQQTTVSTPTLNAMIKNKTEELEKLKQRLDSILNANSEAAVSISGLTDTVLVTRSRLDEQMIAVEDLASRLEEQRLELAVLKESYAGNENALERNRQEVMDIKELLEMEQARSSQALEEQLMSVRRSLEEHQKSTHSLHSHLAAQLEIIQSQKLAESQQLDSAEEEIVEEQAATEEEVPIKDKTVMEEKEFTEEVLVQEEFEKQVVTEEEEPVEEVQVQVEEVVEEQVKEDEIPEDVYLQKDVEEQAVTEKEELAEEIQFHKEEVVEEQAGTEDEIPEEQQVKEDVVEEPPVSEELSKKIHGVEAVTEQSVTEEEVQAKDGDVAEEKAVRTEEEITEEYQDQGEEVVEEQGGTEDEIPEEQEVKEDVVEEHPVSEELSKKIHGVEAVKEQAVTEEEVLSEDVQAKHGDVAEEKAVSTEDEINEEFHDQGEEVDEEQKEGDKEDLTSTEETKNEAEAAKDLSEDQVVGDISLDETSQESFEEPFEGIEQQIDFVEVVEDVQYSEYEEENPAELEVEELDEQDISAD